MNLNYVIRRELRKQNMTAKKLAAAAPTSVQNANQILYGPPVDMRLSTFEKLAEACGCNVVLVRRDRED